MVTQPPLLSRATCTRRKGGPVLLFSGGLTKLDGGMGLQGRGPGSGE